MISLSGIATKIDQRASASPLDTTADIVRDATTALAGELSASHKAMIEDGCPDIVLRPNTPAAKANVTKIINRAANPKIKNPPDKAKPSAAALGMAPAQLQSKTPKAKVPKLPVPPRRLPVPAEGNTTAPHGVVVGKTIAPAPKAKLTEDTTMRQTTSKSKAKTNARTPAAAGERTRYDWAGAEEAAKKGKVPSPPDFSADTHARFRPMLAEVVKAAKAGDAKALKAVEINPVSTSPKAVARYRDICLVAVKAKAVA